MAKAQSEQEEAGVQFCRVMTILTPQLVRRLDAEAARKTVNRSILIRQACETMLQQSAKEAA